MTPRIMERIAFNICPVQLDQLADVSLELKKMVR
jgi:hypothetical protein